MGVSETIKQYNAQLQKVKDERAKLEATKGVYETSLAKAMQELKELGFNSLDDAKKYVAETSAVLESKTKELSDALASLDNVLAGSAEDSATEVVPQVISQAAPLAEPISGKIPVNENPKQVATQQVAIPQVAPVMPAKAEPVDLGDIFNI